MEIWMSSKELRRIADIVDSCQGLRDSLMDGRAVSAESNEFNINIYDCDDVKLGCIRWGDSGAAFYPSVSCE